VRWVAHIDLAALLDSELFGALSEREPDLDLRTNPDLDELREALGFDPIDAIDSITAFGLSRDEDAGVIMVRCDARVEDALAVLEQHLERSQEQVDGATIARWIDPEDRQGDPVYTYLASKSDSDQRLLMISGHPDDLSQAISAIHGESETLAEHPGRLELGTLPGSLLFLSFDSRLAALAEDGELDEFARLVERAQVQMGERDGRVFMDLRVTTADSDDALLATQILQGGLAVLGIAARGEPELKQLLPLINDLHFSAEGAELSVQFSEDVDQLMDLLQQLDDANNDEDGWDGDSDDDPGKAEGDDRPGRASGKKRDGWY